MAFMETFIEVRNGGAAIEMEEGLSKVIEAVQQTGKAGKLTLVLSIKPAQKGYGVEMVFLQDTIKVDCPKPNKKDTMFFIGENNTLSRRDQRQLNMLDGLKDVNTVQPGAPKEIK
jgi:hypothetical protein